LQLPKLSTQGTSSLKCPIILIIFKDTDKGPVMFVFSLAEPFAIIVPGRLKVLGCKYSEVILSGSVSGPQFVKLLSLVSYFASILLMLNLALIKVDSNANKANKNKNILNFISVFI